MRFINLVSSKKRLAGLLVVLLLVVGAVTQIGPQAKAAGLAVDRQVVTHQTSARSNNVISPALTTTQTNDLLVAFIMVDGPSKAGGQSVSSVVGGGLSWKLGKRTNTQAGTSEIWTAAAPSILKNVTVKATYSGSYQSSLVVTAFSNAKTTIGAVGGGNANTGAPSATLTTTQPGSWVWGAGNDWDSPVSRTVPSGQTKVDEYLSSAGNTYWVQRQNGPTALPAGTQVTINDTAPTTDRWNLSTVEVLPYVSSTTPPVISNISAGPLTQSSAVITWTTDENASSQVEYGPDATYGSSTTLDSTLSTSHSKALSGLNSTTTYHYRVKSVDSSKNQSVSNDAIFTTTAVQTSTAAPGISKGIVEDSNAQIGQDAIDMQNAGIKWDRGWLECGTGNSSDTLAMVQALQSHGVTFLPTYNCATTTSIATYQSMLTADMNALKPYGVHTWEIGNEMDGGWTSENNYCNNNASPGNMTCAEQAYLVFQKAAYTTIHANDPQGSMIYGGLSNWSTNLGPWLTAMKNDQAWQWMDGMGFHPYGGTVSNSMAAMDSLKSYMSQNSVWSSKPIWATEVGCWSSGLSSGQQSPCSPQTEAGKSAYLTGLMDAMKAWNKGTSFEIRTPICWYIMHESGTANGYGLVTASNPRTYLPAYTAYKNYLGF